MRAEHQKNSHFEACRLHTINCRRLGLTRFCDPKGSEQFCNEFSTSGGGLHRPPLFCEERLSVALGERMELFLHIAIASVALLAYLYNLLGEAKNGAGVCRVFRVTTRHNFSNS